MIFFSKTSKIYKNFNVDHFKTSDLSAALEKVDVERQEPDGDSEKCQSEWDDVIVDETFARLVKVYFRKIPSFYSGRVTCDFDDDYPDANSLAVTKNEIIDVSLR